MMSFRSRAGLMMGAAMLASPAWSQPGPAEEERGGELRGKLFCLAAYAKNVNPGEPKDLIEAFFDSDGIAPRELKGIGTISFPIRTAHADAQKWFNQGVACLHVLMEEEAERAFRQVITIDPEAPIGYWGLAMANLWSSGRAAYFIRLAQGKIQKDSPSLERDLIDATARLFALPRDPEVMRSRLAPFTLLSDGKMEVFRRSFVFNDFEQRPLHGTVLIDPDGKARWSHINNRPFMEPKWLLQEARRLIQP